MYVNQSLKMERMRKCPDNENPTRRLEKEAKRIQRAWQEQRRNWRGVEERDKDEDNEKHYERVY